VSVKTSGYDTSQIVVPHGNVFLGVLLLRTGEPSVPIKETEGQQGSCTSLTGNENAEAQTSSHWPRETRKVLFGYSPVS